MKKTLNTYRAAQGKTIKNIKVWAPFMGLNFTDNTSLVVANPLVNERSVIVQNPSKDVPLLGRLELNLITDKEYADIIKKLEAENKKEIEKREREIYERLKKKYG